MRTLLLIPSHIKVGRDSEVAADRHPTMDFDALAAKLRSMPENEVELWDFGAVDRAKNPVVRLANKVAGRSVALAVMGFLRRGEYDAVFTNAENVALPLAMLLKLVPRRPRHVTIAHRLSPRKKQLL